MGRIGRTNKNRRTPTPEQLEVVRLPGGPARVLAGAGSGKTYTMTELVRSRVDDHLRGYGGTPPERLRRELYSNGAQRFPWPDTRGKGR